MRKFGARRDLGARYRPSYPLKKFLSEALSGPTTHSLFGLEYWHICTFLEGFRKKDWFQFDFCSIHISHRKIVNKILTLLIKKSKFLLFCNNGYKNPKVFDFTAFSMLLHTFTNAWAEWQANSSAAFWTCTFYKGEGAAKMLSIVFFFFCDKSL